MKKQTLYEALFFIIIMTIAGVFLFRCNPLVAQTLDHNKLKQASSKAAIKAHNQLTPELSRLTDLSEMDALVREMQSNVIPEKKLYRNKKCSQKYKSK